jgi:hypothetical protein
MRRSIQPVPRPRAGSSSLPPLLWLGGSVVTAIMLIGAGLSVLGPLPGEAPDVVTSLRQASNTTRSEVSDTVIRVAATAPR